jgi:hypothetical protein
MSDCEQHQAAPGAISLGPSRSRLLAHSRDGPGACSGRFPHQAAIGGPLLTLGAASLAKVGEDIGYPFAFRKTTSCARVIRGNPSAGAGNCLRRVRVSSRESSTGVMDMFGLKGFFTVSSTTPAVWLVKRGYECNLLNEFYFSKIVADWRLVSKVSLTPLKMVPTHARRLGDYGGNLLCEGFESRSHLIQIGVAVIDRPNPRYRMP